MVRSQSWPRKVKREVDYITGSPLGPFKWLMRAVLRTAFVVVALGVPILLYNEPERMRALADGPVVFDEVHGLALSVLTTELGLLLGIVALLAFVAPFLPDRRTDGGPY
ncbi:hypothetical protein ACFO0N_18250 [Halobium salinum]|uniref:Uncharacterized protein n=1 Tax=Halobium salinum TaxID=1364940 RepID=A0ABD5PGS3_9EURY|nr:hypothetical protein [Halobium salinum]